MRNNSQASRRSFLSSLAILSAGAAMGSVTGFFESGKGASDLKQRWVAFCKHAGAKNYPGSLEAPKNLVAAAGHSHEAGEMVYFPGEDLAARPCWIYWGKDRSVPSDMVITFFEKKNGRFEKIRSYNRFELEAVYQSKEKLEDLSFLKTTTEQNLHTKTFIRRKEQVQEVTYSQKKQILFTDRFIHRA